MALKIQHLITYVLKAWKNCLFRELPDFYSEMGIIIKTINSGGLVGFCI